MSSTLVWYVMYTFCDWYKNAGTHVIFYSKITNS